MYQHILLFGCRGMLAHAIRRALVRRALRCDGVDREECDITDPTAVMQTLRRIRPSLVINCSGYTAVDKAEREEQIATQINGDGPAHLAAACREVGATLVHYSTDFVFDGTNARPYREDDKPNPLSAYARSKLAGELAVQNSGLENWLMLRTAWLYGPSPNGSARPFPRIILDGARAGKPLRVVNDQRGSPTFTFDLAEATFDLLDAGARGLFHATNAGQTTWFDFARAVCDAFHVEPVELTPITSAQWAKMRPDSARRPASSVLDLSKLQQALGREMRPWEAGLRDYCAMTAGAA